LAFTESTAGGVVSRTVIFVVQLAGPAFPSDTVTEISDSPRANAASSETAARVVGVPAATLFVLTAVPLIFQMTYRK